MVIGNLKEINSKNIQSTFPRFSVDYTLITHSMSPLTKDYSPPTSSPRCIQSFVILGIEINGVCFSKGLLLKDHRFKRKQHSECFVKFVKIFYDMVQGSKPFPV